MTSAPQNLARYEADLLSLIERTEKLVIAMQRSLDTKLIDGQIVEALGDDAPAYIASLPDFREEYQAWYSESLVLLKHLLPDRLNDFRSHYEKPRVARKEITAVNYVVDDFMQGLSVSRGGREIVGPKAALPQLEAQVAILKSVRARFKSSLFDIKQMVQADVFDTELAGATELIKAGFFRAAGVVAGVVLERHLQTVIDTHGLKVKAKPTLGDFIQALKDGQVLQTPDWRRLQHLNELRVKCTHNKGAEPTATEATDLIDGVDRTVKTVF